MPMPDQGRDSPSRHWLPLMEATRWFEVDHEQLLARVREGSIERRVRLIGGTPRFVVSSAALRREYSVRAERATPLPTGPGSTRAERRASGPIKHATEPRTVNRGRTSGRRQRFRPRNRAAQRRLGTVRKQSEKVNLEDLAGQMAGLADQIARSQRPGRRLMGYVTSGFVLAVLAGICVWLTDRSPAELLGDTYEGVAEDATGWLGDKYEVFAEETAGHYELMTYRAGRALRDPSDSPWADAPLPANPLDALLIEGAVARARKLMDVAPGSFPSRLNDPAILEDIEQRDWWLPGPRASFQKTAFAPLSQASGQGVVLYADLLAWMFDSLRIVTDGDRETFLALVLLHEFSHFSRSAGGHGVSGDTYFNGRGWPSPGHVRLHERDLELAVVAADHFEDGGEGALAFFHNTTEVLTVYDAPPVSAVVEFLPCPARTSGPGCGECPPIVWVRARPAQPDSDSPPSLVLPDSPRRTR